MGFNGIGVDGLAAAAVVTSGAFYSNFANKEAMLEAVVVAFPRADVSRAQPPVREAYERKISMLAQRISGVLNGKRPIGNDGPGASSP